MTRLGYSLEQHHHGPTRPWLGLSCFPFNIFLFPIIQGLFSPKFTLFVFHPVRIQGANTLISACLLSCFSRVRLFATLQIVACQAPLFMAFSRQDYWSGLSCHPPGDVPYSGIKLVLLMSPALAVGFFTTSANQEATDYWTPTQF